MSGDSWGCQNWGVEATGIQQVETNAVPKHPAGTTQDSLSQLSDPKMLIVPGLKKLPTYMTILNFKTFS